MSSSSSIKKGITNPEVDSNPDLEGFESRADNVENYIRKDQVWYKTPHLIKLNLAVFLCTLASTNNGYDGSMLNGLQSLPSWQAKINPSGDSVKLGALSNGTIFGSVIGLPFVPFVVDRLGRRFGIFLGQSLCLLGAILQGLSTNYGFFLAARLILGLGNSFMVVLAPALISEIAFPSHREIATTFYNTCWYLGAFIAALVTMICYMATDDVQRLTDDWVWRIPSYVQGFMPLLQVLLIFFVPESPRFYISRGQNDKAEAMLKKHHIGNSEDPIDLALVEFEMKEIQTAIELEKLNTQSSYLDFVKLKNFRKRLFLLLFTAGLMQLSGNGLVSYYLNKVLTSIGIKDSLQQLKINVYLMLYNMVLSMAVAFVVKFFKRRRMFLVSLTSMLVCYILWTILSALASQRGYPKSLSNSVLAFIFLYYFAYDIGLNGLPILYITEILPYTHRAKGLNIFQLAQTCTLIYNGYVNPVAMDAIEWKYYIVWTCYLAVELVIVFLFYPETKIHDDVTLEEIGKIFGDDVVEVKNGLYVGHDKPEVEHV